MKKLLTFLVISVLVIGLGMTDLSSGPLKPPLAYTGAPGEGDCTSCHTGTALNGGGGNVSLAFSGAGNTYKLDKWYTVTVTVTDASQTPLCCFEATTLTAANHPVGKFKVITPDNTLVRNSPVNGRTYVSNYENVNFYQQWSYKWKSPATDKGPIIMYAAGNASDNSGNPMGDHIYTTSLTINPAAQLMKAGESEGEESFAWQTLIHQQLTLNYSLVASTPIKISLYNLRGQLQETLFDGVRDAGSYQDMLTLKNQYAPGIYILMIQHGVETETDKVMIQ